MTAEIATTSSYTATWDAVGVLLEELSSQHQASLLLEDVAGRVTGHALVSHAPAAAIEAVLTRTSAPLHQQRKGGRVVPGLTPAPVVRTRFADWPHTISIVPLLDGGWVWSFHSRDASQVDVSRLCADLQQLGPLLGRFAARATDAQLFDELVGDAQPSVRWRSGFLAAIRFLDERSSAPRLHEALRRALPVSSKFRITVTTDMAYVQLTEGLTSREAGHALNQALPIAGADVGSTLAGTFTRVSGDLPSTKATLERALTARAVAGRCLTVEECRPYAVLPGLMDAVHDTRGLGDDPLAALFGHDRSMWESLLAWLDAMGNTSLAAATLKVHGNTLRYRIRRAQGLLGLDLDDPVARLYLHLRLLAHLSHQDTLHLGSNASTGHTSRGDVRMHTVA
jgi:hypothetical protein